MPTFTIDNPAREHATVSAPPIRPVLAMRRFGVELETLAPAGTPRPQNHASALLSGLGIRNEIAGAYGRNYGVWQCKSDGSIQPYGQGVEVVSRIMPANESSYDEIRMVAEKLESDGYKVNRSCGMHVHVNVQDLPFHVRQLIVLRYAQLRPDLDSMLPPSRRSGANGFCQTMTPASFSELARNIDSGIHRWPVMAISGGSSYDHYSATNVQWASQSNDSTRIEFRQAAASVSADKIIAWVRFLQEMVTEVARRAAGMTFSASQPVAPSYPARPQTFGGRVPNVRWGSDQGRALRQLCNTGVLTPAWCAEQGIQDNVMRRIITGFRRHGAGIVTARNGREGASYVLSGVTSLPVTPESIFAGTTLQPAPMPAPTPAPVASVTAREFVAYPFNAGLSAATIAWCDRRRAHFAARPAA